MRIFYLFITLLFFCSHANSQEQISKTAAKMQKAGYVNIHDLDKTIKVSLMYSRADNFTGTILYDDLREAYLHPIAAKALVKAQKRLKELRPDLSLKVYDAARPMYTSMVVSADTCPMIADRVLISMPFSSAIVAKVWRRS